MKKEWFILEYERKEYLHNIKLSYTIFTFNNTDHHHCELCWAKFSNNSDDLREGYYDSISKSVICPDCYHEFKDLFGWESEVDS